MASSFIDFRDNGFWSKDRIVEAIQLLLFEEIQLQYQDRQLWLNEYKKELALQSLPLIHGGMSLRLEETLVDENRKEIILSLIDSIRVKIWSDADYLTAQHLQQLRRVVRRYLVETGEFDWDEKEIESQVNDGAWVGDGPLDETRYCERGFELLKSLIKGQLHFKADTAITYWAL